MLFVYWTVFVIFFLAQAHHERAMQNDELARFVAPHYFKALQISTLLALIAGAALLVYCFLKMPWYWPLILLFGGGPLGALALGFFSTRRPLVHLSKLGFVMLPVAIAGVIYNVGTP